MKHQKWTLTEQTAFLYQIKCMCIYFSKMRQFWLAITFTKLYQPFFLLQQLNCLVSAMRRCVVPSYSRRQQS